MALSRITELGERLNLAASTSPLSYTTTAFTPPDDCLLVACVGLVNGAGGADVQTGMALSGGGLTWTKRTGPNGGTVSGYTSAQEIWTAPVVSGASMSLTYAHTGDVGTDQSRAHFSVLSYTSSTGTLSIGATATGAHDQGDDAVSITLGSAPDTSSEVVAARWYSSNGNDQNAIVGTGWTEIYDDTYSGYGSLQSQIRGSSTSTSVDWVDVADGITGGSWNSSAMAVEVVESVGAAGGNTNLLLLGCG